MKKQLLRFTLYAIIIYLTCGTFNLAVAASPPSGRNGTHFCGVIDSQSDKQHSDQFPNRNYARSLAANLNVGEPRTVRMIYFLPNDRPYRADMVQRMKYEILKVQTFFAEQMEAHGYGTRTFRIETDQKGEPKVHRVDGQHPKSDYQTGNGASQYSEIEQAGFDITANVYLVVMDLSNGHGGHGRREGKNGGRAMLLGHVRFSVVVHELGHAFGLSHDFRDQTYMMSYGKRRNQLSACTADYLSVHPYFNPDTPIEEGPPPSIELISSRRYPTGAKSFPIRFKVRGSAGLHQVLLITGAPILSSMSVKSCRRLKGEREVVVEFNYDGTSSTPSNPQGTDTSLSDPLAHLINIKLVDTDGNVDFVGFPLYSEAVEPLMKISGDNQVGLPNTPLHAPFVVHVLNLFTRRSPYGVPTVPLTFTVTAGGGTLSVERTWSAFRAESTLTLGPNLGTNTVEVSAEGFTVTFNAEAVAPEDIPYANLPDPNLQAAIEDTLGVPPGTPIAQAAIATLPRLEARNANISYLTGLESATNLRELYLENNSISDISAVAGLTNLTTLRLSGNSISDISAVAGLTNLRELYLENNSISDISAVADLTSLTQLGFADNNISDISAVAGLTNLIELWLSGNSISDISAVAGLTNLTELWLSGNSISDISAVAGLTNLRKLWLRHNSISDISAVTGLTHLIQLALGYNSISDISAVAGLTNLRELYLQNNSISDISAVADLTSLTRLGFADNNISDISAVAGLTNLTWLTLDRNNISDISALSGLTNLRELWLRHNSISDISAVTGLTHLIQLTLGYNSISDLSPLVANTGLGEGARVDLWGNPLSYQSIHTHIPTLQSRGVDVNFDNRTPTRLVKISGDQHSSPAAPLPKPLVVEVRDENGNAFAAGVPVTFTVTSGGGTLSITSTTTDADGRAESTLTLGPNLGTTTVEVSAAEIEEKVTFTAVARAGVTLPDSNLRAAVGMGLGVSPDAGISPSQLVTLTNLNASDTEIGDLTGLEFATNLTSLYLEYNNISDISALAGLTNLTWLTLDRNNISDISALAGLTNLTWLTLDRNNISDISALSGLTNLTWLTLDRNHISDISALAGLINLTQLRLTENNISDIPALAGLTNLTSLYLGYNNISDISALSGLTNLTWLTLDRNHISDISALAGLINLTQLRLTENNISDIPALAGLTNLTSLYLGYNNISDISALSGLINLTWLNLGQQHFRHFSGVGLNQFDISVILGITTSRTSRRWRT